MSNRQSETVVLVHGLAGSRLDMLFLAKRLRSLGFNVENWGYWSLNTSIQTHADRLAAALKRLENSDSVERIHLVGHSMGGIIIRAAMEEHHDAGQGSKIQRAILLAPPNRGSHVATKLDPWLGWLAPSLSELSDRDESFVNQLPNSLRDSRLEFGVVEATKDRVIRPDCVQLDGQTDFAKIEGHHGILTWYPKTGQLVEHFLLTGQFSSGVDREDKTSTSAGAEDNALSV